MQLPSVVRGGIMPALAAAVCSLLLSLIPIQNLHSQEGTGSVSGRVMDIRTGQFLSNTRVSVEGTSIQAVTNQFGEFTLSAVPSGSASIRAFYTGYFDSTQTIEVKPGVAERLEFALRSRASFDSDEDAYELDAFEVVSQYDAVASAIHEQRFSESNIAVVNAESLGNINEGNIGEFVKYLPGISINYVAADVRSIEVRGMGDTFTNVTVDGNMMASASSSNMNRTFELEQVSLNNVERIEVVKVPTSDMPASSLGGSVNLVSKSAFERDGREIRYNAYFSANSEQLTLSKTPGPGNRDTYKIRPGLKLTYADVFMDGKLGLIVNYLNSNQFNPQHRSQQRWAFNDYVNGVSSPQPMLRRYTMQDGPKITTRESVNVKVDFKISENTFILSSIQWNDYHSGFRNTNVTWDTGITTTAANQTSETGVMQTAPNRGRIDFGGSWRDKFGDTWHGDIKIQHTMNDLKLEAGAYWSKATNFYKSYDKGFVEGATLSWINMDGVLRLSDYGGNNDLDLTTTIEHIDGAGKNNPGLGVSDLGVYAFTEITPFRPKEGEDKLTGVNLDATYTLDKGGLTGYLKTGVRYSSQDRFTLDIRDRYYHVGPDGIRNSGDEFISAGFINDKYAFEDPHYGIAPVIAWPDYAKIKDYFDANPSHFTFRGRDGQGINNIEESILAGYAMGSIDLFNKRAAVTAGVRWEKTEITAKGNRDNRAVDSDYDGFYPSIALRWDITNRIVGRLAYARTIGRQNFSQLLPNANISYSDDLQDGSVRVNNTGLNPQQADSVDLSLEYYTDNAGVLSATYFYKKITDYIQSVGRLVTQADIDAFNLPGDTLGFSLTTQRNAGDATIHGVELNAVQKLTFLPDAAGIVSVFANGTFLDIEGNFGGTATETDLAQFVKETYNFGLSWEKFGVLANLKYSHKGKELLRPFTADGSGSIGDVREFNDALSQIDFDVEYTINPNYTIYFSARNLNNEPQSRILESKSADLRLISQSEEFGVQFALGVKGKF